MRLTTRLPHRSLACALVLIAWTGACPAQNIDEQALKACIDKPDAERLQCYDAVVRPPAQQEQASPTGTPPPAKQTDQAIPAKLSTADIDCLHRRTNPNTPLECHWELDSTSKRGAGGLWPHKQTYALPVRWGSSPNAQPLSPTEGAAPAQSLDHLEAKFQFSLKTKLWENIGPTQADLWFAYTQQSYWQVYNQPVSRPFRENDYEPELFVVWPVQNTKDNGLRFVSVGLVHQSNGRSDPLSRSWNRLYAQLGFQHNRFALLARAWWRIPEGSSDDNNPDIEHYMGYGDLLAVYKPNLEQTVSLLVRNNFNFSSNKGAVQLDWSFPSGFHVKGLKWYVQLFSGYGESLIDYNWRQTTIGFGLLLADWM